MPPSGARWMTASASGLAGRQLEERAGRSERRFHLGQRLQPGVLDVGHGPEIEDHHRGFRRVHLCHDLVHDALCIREVNSPFGSQHEHSRLDLVVRAVGAQRTKIVRARLAAEHVDGWIVGLTQQRDHRQDHRRENAREASPGR
jgi:hypothetical protein